MIDLDYDKIEDIELDGIDTQDFPDFSEAFILSASYKGKPMSEELLDWLNEDRYFVHTRVIAELF